VFEGAVIGQVFTGDVKLECPFMEMGRHKAPESRRGSSPSAFCVAAILLAPQAAELFESLGLASSIQAAMLLASGLLVQQVRATSLGRFFRACIKMSFVVIGTLL
jgi:hypothetical protein